MAWQKFPLTNASTKDDILAGAQELHDACVERGMTMGTLARPEAGRKIKYSFLSALRNVVATNINESVNGNPIYRWGKSRGSNFTVFVTAGTSYNQAAWNDGVTTTNVFLEVYGSTSGRTTWRTTRIGTLLHLDDLNEIYKVLDELKIRHYWSFDPSVASGPSQSQKRTYAAFDSWDGVISGYNGSAWATQINGMPVSTILAYGGGSFYSIAGERGFTSVRVQLLNIAPSGPAVLHGIVNLSTGYPDTTSGAEFTINIRHGTGSPPSSVLGARAWSTSAGSITKSLSATVSAFSTFNIPVTANALLTVVGVYPHDSFSSWNLSPSPPESIGTSAAGSGGFYRLFVPYAFSKAS